MEIFRVAEKYQIESLQKECEKIFAKSAITCSNALEIYQEASKYGARKVQLTCEETFENDTDIMLQRSFKYAHRSIVKKVLRKKTRLELKYFYGLIDWAKHECLRSHVEVTIANVRSCILSICGSQFALYMSQVIGNLIAMNGECYIDIKKSFPKDDEAVPIRLRESVCERTLLCSFDFDVICELKISVLKGTLEFTGITFRLNPSTSPWENRLDAFYITENMTEGTNVFNVRSDYVAGENGNIMFNEGLVVKSGQFAKIHIGIEDLQIYRCLENVSPQKEVIYNDVHFILELSSNHIHRYTDTGPFFIERLLFREFFGGEKNSD